MCQITGKEAWPLSKRVWSLSLLILVIKFSELFAVTITAVAVLPKHYCDNTVFINIAVYKTNLIIFVHQMISE